jgi:hypothetical protein
MESEPMMSPLTRQDLMSLEQYSDLRPDFRSRVMQHKRHRRVSIGPDLHLYFEDRLTIQYQVQEMLRIERIFEADAIQEELDAYNPLIPEGNNWKATAMLEYTDVDQRKRQLAILKGIEDLVWIQVEGHDPVYAISNEDMERSNDEKTSAVHFMRFELSPTMIASLFQEAALNMGVNHDFYQHQTTVSGASRNALLADLAETDQ